MFFTKDKLLTTIIKCMPYSNQMTELDTTSEENAISFTWRANRFRVNVYGYTEEVRDGILIRSNIAILITALLTLQYISDL